MIKKYRKYFRVFKELVRIRFQGLMMFKIGFFGPFLVDASLFAVQLFVFQAIYTNVDRIGTWGEGEMILFIGTFSLIQSLSMMIFSTGISRIPEKIKGGELDLYLTKPVSPLFRLTFEQVNPGSIPALLMSLCVIVYGFCKAGLSLRVGMIFRYLGWIIIMTVLYYDLMILMRAVSFYLVTNARLEQFEEAALELCRKVPGFAFYGVYRIVFCLFLPYGIIATWPVENIAGKMNFGKSLYGVMITIVFTGLTMFVWRDGVKHYNSASS